MYFRILVPIDGSPASARGLREAIELAAALGSELVLLNAVEDLVPLPSSGGPGQPVHPGDAARLSALTAAGQVLLERAQDDAAEAGVRALAVQRGTGRVHVADTILDEAAARECGLIVIGTHGRRGHTTLALGGDADRVVHGATMPVLLVR